MPFPKVAILALLAFLTEALAAFPPLVASGLLHDNPWGYAAFWPALALGALGVALALGLRAARPKGREPVLVLVALGVCLSCLPAVVLSRSLFAFLAAAVLLALAFWRGATCGWSDNGYLEIQHRLVVGVGAFFLSVAGLAASGAIHRVAVWHALTLSGVGLVVAGMCALAAVRLEIPGAPRSVETVVAAVGGQLVLLLAVSAAAFGLLTLDLGGWIARLLGPVGSAVGGGLVGVMHSIFGPLLWLSEYLHTHLHAPAHRTQPAIHRFVPRHRLAHPSSYLSLPRGVAFALITLSVLVILAAAWLVLRNRRSLQAREGEDDERDQKRVRVVSPVHFWRALGQWLRALFSSGTADTAHRMAAVRRKVFGPPYPTDPVRRFYARLLRHAQKQGLPRPPWATPWEFQAMLARRWPEASDDLAFLTEAYIRRRYLEAPAREGEMGALDRRWKRARSLMREVAAPDAPA